MNTSGSSRVFRRHNLGNLAENIDQRQMRPTHKLESILQTVSQLKEENQTLKDNLKASRESEASLEQQLYCDKNQSIIALLQKLQGHGKKTTEAARQAQEQAQCAQMLSLQLISGISRVIHVFNEADGS